MEEYEKIQTRIENISQEIDILKEKYSDIYDLDQMFFDLKNDFE